MSSPPFHVNHNVYILGAGFSKEAGLPVLSDFLQVMRETRATGGLSPEENTAIDAILHFRRYASMAAAQTHIDLNNLEDLLSLAAAVPPDPSQTQGGSLSDLSIAIGAVLEHRQRIYAKSGSKYTIQAPTSVLTKNISKWELSASGKKYGHGVTPTHAKVPAMDMYLAIMTSFLGGKDGQKNTLITFNYDTLIEEAFTRMGISFTYGLHPLYALCSMELPETLPMKWLGDATDDVPQLLKLHGSINWAEEDRSPITLESDVNRAHQPTKPFVYDDFKSLRKSERWPMIEPPTWRKNQNDILRLSWNEAVNQLKTATRIIIMGYSCPETDPHFRFLLAAGLLENIALTKVWVVNPDMEAFKRVQSMLSGERSGVPVQHVGQISQMLANIGSLEEIGRRPLCWTGPPT